MTFNNSSLEALPSEMLLDIISLLDYKSVLSVSTTSRALREVALDTIVWKDLYGRTFSTGRRNPKKDEWQHEYRCKMNDAREFIVRGGTDYNAAMVRALFTEMGAENERLIADLLWASNLSLNDIIVRGQGYIIRSAKNLLPHEEIVELEGYLEVHKVRLEPDARSETYLHRLLLARHSAYQAHIGQLEIFVKCAHLIAYNALEHPLYYFPSSTDKRLRSDSRYHLRQSVTSGDDKSDRSRQDTEIVLGPVVNWGVVETIHSLMKLYKDRMGAGIPGFDKSRHDFEAEVPMTSSMFDADLSGNWIGLYAYLDFRELQVLDASRPFTPDIFDGLQSLRFSAEQCKRADRRDRDNQQSEVEDNIPCSLSSSKMFFVAEGVSVHGEFHIHGSTMHIPGMEAGFKIVKFDDMYSNQGLMPWIMDGIYVPSIGIIGRWRDRTEPLGEAVEGPYILWRDRRQDLLDQEMARDLATHQGTKQPVDSPRSLPVKYATGSGQNLSYIVIEDATIRTERSST